MRPSEIINWLTGRTREIHIGTLELQQEAFRPTVNDPDNPENLVQRNAVQIAALIGNTKSQLADVDTVITEAKALRRDIARSLEAWEAAGAVLEAPRADLTARIKDAAAETAAEPGTMTRMVGDKEYRIADIAEYFGKFPMEIINMSDATFESLAASYDNRAVKSKRKSGLAAMPPVTQAEINRATRSGTGDPMSEEQREALFKLPIVTDEHGDPITNR